MSARGGTLDALSRAIGGLEEAVKGLQKGLDDERAEAKQHRDSLRNVIDGLAEAVRTIASEVNALKRDVKDVGKDVHDMKPIVEDYERKRHEARGSAKLVHRVHKGWVAIGGAGLVGAALSWLAAHHWKWLLLVAVLCGAVVGALAKDNGQWAQVSPKERQWFREQKQPGTNFLCCNEADGELVDEEIRNGEYWIQSEKTGGKWMKVPDHTIIREPNMHGRPIAWFRWLQGNPQIFCYAPGGGI